MRKMLPMMGVLAGCGIDSMDGDWSGDLSCFDGAEVRLEIEVDDSEGALEYIGDFFLRAATLYETDGETFRLESDWAGTLAVTQVLPSGEQEVAIVLKERAPDCRVFKEGNLLSEDCYEDGMPLGYEFVGEFVGDWDGLDILEVDNGYCSGELDR